MCVLIRHLRLAIGVGRTAIVIVCLLASVVSSSAATKPQPRSLKEYRDHLQSLAALIEQCRQQSDAAHCSLDNVGSDDLVTVPGQETRLVSYDWLRDPLERIANRKLSPADAAPVLKAAARRIQIEQSEAPGNTTPTAAAADHTLAHNAVTAILARAEFRRKDASLMQRALESAAIWINRQLGSLAKYSSQRPWLGRLLEWGLVALACLGLALWYVRQTRRARGLDIGNAHAVENAPLQRNWERLRQDAELAAQQQRWRDAVRAYYWATIARLESRGLWPADRARTPREYLRLLVADHPKHHDLRQLTRRFEACWYGADSATQPDCDAARLLFERLAV